MESFYYDFMVEHKDHKIELYYSPFGDVGYVCDCGEMKAGGYMNQF